MLITIYNVKEYEVREKNKFGVINWDVVSYYSYLPATFIEGDVTLDFMKNPDTSIVYRQNHRYWPIEAESGNLVIKTTMGNAFLYSPFFFIAHTLASPLGYKKDGFSTIYQLLIVISSVFYTVLGLIFLRLILLRYFSEIITSMGLILVLFGTNMFYYSAFRTGLTHPNSFFLVTLFIHGMIKWEERPSWKISILIGVCIGMIALLRPTNVLIVIVFIAYILTKRNIHFIIKYWLQIGLITFLALIVCLPQLIYWKTLTGMWIYNSYVGEHFYFNNPHIFRGLFSYRNGWLTYTPLMLFSIIGLFFIKNKSWKNSIIMFLPPFLYVTYSWWCWWYGGSFGSRPMIDVYGLLMISICSFIMFLWKIPKIGVGVALLFFSLFLAQGVFFTVKKHNFSIHFDGMNSEVYWDNLWYIKPRKGRFWEKITRPDYELAKEGIYEY